LPAGIDKYAREGETVAAAILGKNMAVSNPLRQGIATYLHAAGSQSGYGFFAPNVPIGHKLIFALYHYDGRVEYEVPRVSGVAMSLRLSSLTDRLAGPEYEPLREVVMRMLTFSNWRQHPDVKRIQAVLGWVNSPTVEEFQRGKRESFQPLFSYEFSLREETNPSRTP